MNIVMLLNGYKTYISIALYVSYRIALQHGLAPIPDLEVLLKSAAAASFVHKVAKLTTAIDEPTPPVGPTA